MALVVFMRGVNVGGHKTFKPKALADDLGAINVGAAGTFVVTGKATETALRTQIKRRLEFDAELMICTGREILDLVAAPPFPKGAAWEKERRYISVLAAKPTKKPKLPLDQPPGAWEVRVLAVTGRFASSFWRPVPGELLDTNKVMEQNLGVRSTTRNWNTIVKIAEILEKQGVR